MINVDKLYVIHVKGAVEREKHINEQLRKHGLQGQFMLNADVPDITQDQLKQYFGHTMQEANPKTSCTLKHFLVYEDMVANNIQNCLVLEDDIILHKNFVPLFNESIAELKSKDVEGAMISYENSSLQFVPKSEKKDGQKLYLRKRGRCTGAYYIDLKAAKAILNHTYTEKCNRVIDWHHNELLEKDVMTMYWMDPPIAEQGSHDGKFASMLDAKDNSLVRRISWKLQELWKRHVMAGIK